MHAHETRIYITLLIAAAVFAVVLGFYMVTIIRQQRKKVLSYNDKIITEILVLEKERGRIAADLHDEMGALLSAIKLNLQCIETPTPKDRQIITKTGKYIDTVMYKIREISNNLAPRSLEKNGLFTAIKELCEMIDQTGKIHVSYFCSSPDMIISKEKEIHVYRMIQEIINNAIRHGRPDNIVVKLTIENNLLSVMIRDDGIGFDQDETVKTNTGFGLRNIISRVDLLKGSIYLETGSWKGVHYMITIPL
jgi:signal transduction histidine kinase